MPADLTRRGLIGGAAAVAGAAAAIGLPPNVQKAVAATRADPPTNHSWAPQHSALNGGANDNWIAAHYAADGATNYQYVMGYYERKDLPFHFSLADNFTICDNYYCGVLGPTYPNRIIHLSGTIDPDGSEHPNASLAAGANFLASKLDAVAANRETWESTVFIINYDENDGLFDHVPPPAAPAGTPDEIVTAKSPYGSTQGDGLPVGPGFRVPCLIISPWTTGGFVCSRPFDHTSVLMFLEKVTGVPCPNISDYRRSTVGDLTAAFQSNVRREPPVYLDTTGQLGFIDYTIANFSLPTAPGATQTVPVQEPGRRPHVG